MSPLPSGADRTARIRQLNDMLRVLPVPPFGQLILTIGVSELPGDDLRSVLSQVSRFDAFTPDNDPHGEHDFGAFDHKGTKYFWKIDYYDLTMERHSADAADPALTRRVLTVMRADEY